MIVPGDNIIWKRRGIRLTDPETWIEEVLSRGIVLFLDRSWDRWGWHSGYVVDVLPSGEIVSSQAIASGVHYVTYTSQEDMGECRIYRWLGRRDGEKIARYAAEHDGEPYDVLNYLWVIIAALSAKYLRWPFRVVDRAKMCWENLAEFDRFMGKELQPEEEPCLISSIVRALEGRRDRELPASLRPAI